MNSSETQSSSDSSRKVKLRTNILSERVILLALFWSLIAFTAAFLAMDFRVIYEQANVALPGESERREPLIMAPPKQRDHVRPYLPRSMPITGRGKGPKMPGFSKPITAALMAKRMAFVRGPKGRATAVGRIEPGTAEEFKAFLEGQNGEVKEIYIHSPGGSVRDALAMSKLIREKDVKTTVPAHGCCASSCPIVLAGGTTRTVGKPAWVGVHQIFAVGDSAGSLADGMAQAQRISARVVEHLTEMGIDPRAWVHAMKTPSNQLYLFTRKELKSYKIATRL